MRTARSHPRRAKLPWRVASRRTPRGRSTSGRRTK
jgi:hypothetical protein